MKGASLIAPFGLRMPEELKEKIAERAKNNGRSMNAEIVQVLQDAIERDAAHNDPDIAAIDNLRFELAEKNSPEEKERYLSALEKKDPFTAAILRESEAHNDRLLKILGKHMGYLEGDD